ncbi:MAG TPA: ribokinase [Bacilli bacterium]
MIELLDRHPDLDGVFAGNDLMAVGEVNPMPDPALSLSSTPPTSSRIVVVGSLNMDLVVSTDRMPRVGETILGNDIHYLAGGKGANQAVGCSKLGANVVMLGAVGEDTFGKQLIETLEEYQVDTAHILKLAQHPTGTATILHMPNDNCIVVVPGANGQFTAERLELFKEQINHADIMLLQLEIPLSTVERALELARASGVKTILNPAPAQALSKKLLQMVDYLTPNETELELLTNQSWANEDELEVVLGQWEQTCGHKVIVTRGEHGCSFMNGNKLHTVPSIKVDVVDTTGAGDAFNASLAFGVTQGWPMEEAVSFAVKAASLSVTKFGATNGMPSLQEVIDFSHLKMA